jgi:ferredoxin-NADP reductase
MSDRPRRPAPQWVEARVVEIVEETADTKSLRLELPETASYLPGQYYNIRLPIEGRPRPVQRAYSLGSSPHPRSRVIEVGVKAVEGGLVSPRLVWQTRVGDVLEVRGPYGTFTWTEQDGGPVLLVGAGSGIVPLMAIIRYQASMGTQVPMHLLYSSRRREEVIYWAALEALRTEHGWLRVSHTFTRDHADPAARFHRRIDKEMVQAVFGEATPRLAYICGPPELVDDVERSLVDAGMDERRIKTEKYD